MTSPGNPPSHEIKKAALEAVKSGRQLWQTALETDEVAHRKWCAGNGEGPRPERTAKELDQHIADAILAALPALKREESACSDEVIGGRHSLDPQDATAPVDGMDLTEMLREPSLSLYTNTELLNMAADEIDWLRLRNRELAAPPQANDAETDPIALSLRRRLQRMIADHANEKSKVDTLETLRLLEDVLANHPYDKK